MTPPQVFYAVPLVVIGWIGLHMRKSALGGVVAILIIWQGVLALAALSVFRHPEPAEGAVLLWTLVFGALLSLASILVLALRRYYSDRQVDWQKNEEIRR